MTTKSIYGYFDEPGQATPTYDPGLDVDCPFCGEKLTEDYLSHSIMPMDWHRSYFYRYHEKHAKEPNFDERQQEIDDTFIDKVVETGID